MTPVNVKGRDEKFTHQQERTKHIKGMILKCPDKRRIQPGIVFSLGPFLVSRYSPSVEGPLEDPHLQEAMERVPYHRAEAPLWAITMPGGTLAGSHSQQ